MAKLKYALVAGGSKGIGYAIALALAGRNYNLVLVARNLDGLTDAKIKIAKLYKVKIHLLARDLSLPATSGFIAGWCQENKIPLSMLCHVAGLGGKNDFLSLTQDELRKMISLNLSSPVTLCMDLLPLLEKNAPSHILHVASMAGFAPIPVKNIYSSTKAALIFLAYSLRYQLKSKKISVSCLCPGPVFTKPEIRKDTLDKLGWFGKLMAVDPIKVGEAAIKNTLKGKLIIIPGITSKIISLLLRSMPRRTVSYIYSRMG